MFKSFDGFLERPRKTPIMIRMNFRFGLLRLWKIYFMMCIFYFFSIVCESNNINNILFYDYCYFFIKIISLIFSGIMQQDNSEQVIIDPRLIARHYIRTWFFLDLISSIPLDYVFLIINSLTGKGVRKKLSK